MLENSLKVLWQSMTSKKPKKPIKIRRSWPKGFNPKTRVKNSSKLYSRSKRKQQDLKENQDG